MSLSFKTRDRHGYSVKFSPYIHNRLACSSSQYYGIAGSGTLFILDIIVDKLKLVQVFNWKQGLFDVTWSENNENIVLTASGDGTIQIWHLQQPQGPIKVLKEHSKEVNSIDWSQTRTDQLLLSGSWDGTIKLWDIFQDRSLSTYTSHENIVYSVNWSPRLPFIFASASGDQTIRIWDRRKTADANMVISAHQCEVLSCDWSKYDENIIISGGVDGVVKCWDLRKPNHFISQLNGHQYAVRKIKTSPFNAKIIATCSYDFTVRFWDILENKLLKTVEHHTEFVYGIDWNLHTPGQIADCSWDELIKVYSPLSGLSS
ncbi:hypothetical protein LOTGIDRAFT_144806 [Lottia gigantea]|uniref:Peroxin-7 n=1 Tax=Lottia gigantea TaxID=225164 RepID=V4AMT9_LOTGI|nr:hypothetical protein LOTGIDRAFT_144806 [Lottia gigantea]ESO94916.1 hypothetical protein LOTGIDRAFT_144806 [Lottia gigantea]